MKASSKKTVYKNSVTFKRLIVLYKRNSCRLCHFILNSRFFRAWRFCKKNGNPAFSVDAPGKCKPIAAVISSAAQYKHGTFRATAENGFFKRGGGIFHHNAFAEAAADFSFFFRKGRININGFHSVFLRNIYFFVKIIPFENFVPSLSAGICEEIIFIETSSS